MYLKCHRRFKNGKQHCYYSICEKRRCAGGRLVDRHVLYLGEINSSQKQAWTKCIKVFDTQSQQQTKLALFPAEEPIPQHAIDYGVRVQLEDFSLRRPRQWGGCWLFMGLWKELKLDEFWLPRLPASRQGTSWYRILMVLCAYRWIDPGSEWRLHRHWYEQSAMADLLGEDFALVAKDNLYRCLDRLLKHKEPLFTYLQGRWKDMFGITHEVLLYDLTSTYFESDPPFEDKRQFGHSRDKRSDCVQVVIGLVVTPEGFPLAYEVLSGNTSDKTTLNGFLKKIERQYGKARRVWVMDRGIPTEEILTEMRESDPPVSYLVGTPKGRLNQLEEKLAQEPWNQVRDQVRVKLVAQEQELYVMVDSAARVLKERSMRRRRLKVLWQRLNQLRAQRPSYETLLLKLGAAKKEAGRVWHLVEVTLPAPPAKGARNRRVELSFALRRAKLGQVRRREGRYLLRSNQTGNDPAQLWAQYMQLVEVEAAFKDIKGDLRIRPIHHQLEHRIEAHIFVCFLAYCVQVSLRQKLRQRAPGLTVRQVLDKFKAMQMVDVHFPTTDGRELIFARYTHPEPDHQLLLDQLKLALPKQQPPRINAKREMEM